MPVRLLGRCFQVVRSPKGLRVATFAGASPVLSVYEAATEQRRAVLIGEQDAVDRLVGAYRVARVRIDRELQAVTAKIEAARAAGVEFSPSWLYKQERWQAFEVTIDTEIARFTAVALAVTQAQQLAVAAQGPIDAAALVRTAGVKSGFIMLPKDAFADLVGVLVDGSPLADLFEKVGPGAVQTARTIFTEEMAAGSHPTVMARRLHAEMKDMSETRAIRIARNETNRVYTTAMQRSYVANSDVVIGQRIMSARDGRVCPICLARDGEILENGETFWKHITCRCTVCPVVRYLDQDRGTGDEWLRTQSVDEQIRLLGPTRHALWSSGDASLSDLYTWQHSDRWGDSPRLKNLTQLRGDVKAGRHAPAPKRTVPGMGLVAGAVK